MQPTPTIRASSVLRKITAICNSGGVLITTVIIHSHPTTIKNGSTVDKPAVDCTDNSIHGFCNHSYEN
jgi:hypothetical protein